MSAELVFLVIFAGLFLVLSPCSPLAIWKNPACPWNRKRSQPDRRLTHLVEEVIEPSRAHPVLLIVHSAGCGPCRKLLAELPADLGVPGLQVVAWEVAGHEDEAESLGLELMPAILLWRDGTEIAREQGYRSSSDLTAWLRRQLGLAAASTSPGNQGTP